MRQWKNFENRPIFDKDMDSVAHFFGGHPVDSSSKNDGVISFESCPTALICGISDSGEITKRGWTPVGHR